MGGARSQRTLVFAAVALLVATVLAVAAHGAEATRQSYREAAEPICKANTTANERIFKGVRAEVRQGRLKPAAIRFSRAAVALKGTLGRLQGIPRPPADGARLAKWFGDVETEVRLFEQVAAKLRAGQKAAAERLVVRLTSNADKANNAVIPFEFEYCRFEPSRFT